MKKKLNNKNTFTTTEMGVLIEDLKSEFRNVGEGLAANTAKLTAIETTVARIWEKITTMDLRLIKTDKDITDIKILFQAQHKRIANLEEVSLK